jgi:hypothetical protein
MNSGESAGPRTPQKLHQHRFRLVVGGVRGRNPVEPVVVRELIEPLIPKFSGGVLKAQFVGSGMCADIAATGEERKIELACQLGNKPFVAIRLFTAQLMVEVRNVNDDAEFLA